LSSDAQAALGNLLPDTDFSNSTSIAASALVNYADFVKHNSNFPQYNGISSPWHFIDIPVEPPFQGNPMQFCPNSDCVIAKIDEFKTVLASKTLPKKRRQEALVFLVHLVGDLHQPLHCATRNDTGGNDLHVKYLGSAGHHPIVLHGVWDGNLVHEAMSGANPVTSAESMNTAITAQNRTNWQAGTIKDWAMESYALARDHAYMQGDGVTSLPTSGKPNLDQAYVNRNKPVVTMQLQKAGIRLAKLLNDALTP
jgi:hypothetical protein